MSICNNSIVKSLSFLTIFFLLFSCDKDFNSVGESLIGDNDYQIFKSYSDVIAYTEKVTPIQSDNLPVNALGIYDNPAFGVTTASFATQVTLAIANPPIGNKPEIESVTLDIPYFIDATQTKSIPSTTAGVAARNTYVLDSIYGLPKAKIKLSVYESGRYMGNQSAKSQVFYTDQSADFEKFKVGDRLNDSSDKSQNDEFFFDPTQLSFTTKVNDKDITTFSEPSMRLKLNNSVFKRILFNSPAGSLATNEVFSNYFKGLYFKVEQSGTDKGSLAMINFRKGTITIKYKEDKSASDAARVEKSIILNLSGNTVSLLEDSNLNNEYSAAINNPDRTFGNKSLFLKGGQGSVVVLKLFEKAGELENIRNSKWLINEANLVFYIDTLNTEFKKSHEPERLYLYDFANKTSLLDYFSSALSTIKNSTKLSLGGFIKRDATPKKRGLYFKVNLTNHIRSLLKNSAKENVKLGLVVSEDLNISEFGLLKKENAFINEVPKSSVMSPLGTVLHGSTAEVPAEKRIKLEINYTKTK